MSAAFTHRSMDITERLLDAATKFEQQMEYSSPVLWPSQIELAQLWQDDGNRR